MPKLLKPGFHEIRCTTYLFQKKSASTDLNFVFAHQDFKIGSKLV